MSDHSRARAR